MTNVVLCSLTHSQARDALDRLQAGGFSGRDSSLLMLDRSAVLGGQLGWLAGVGTFTVPGVGPLIVAGPLVGAAGGDLTALFIGMGVSHYEAELFAARVASGHALVCVQSDNPDDLDRAEEIFDAVGAADVVTSLGAASLPGLHPGRA